MKREELIAMGISEENVEKSLLITAVPYRENRQKQQSLRQRQTAQMSCRKSWMKWKQETSRNLKKQTRR